MNLSDLKRNKSCENLYHPKLNEKKKKLPRKKTIKIQFQKTIKSNEQKTKELTNQQNLNLLNAKSSHNLNVIQNIINSNKDISNLSSSMGKNFVLKSDYLHKSHEQNNYKKEESNPWFSYYGVEKPPKNIVNDYLLFVQKFKGDIDDYQELFDNNESYINKNKKEIIISTYVDDEETIKYYDVNDCDNESENDDEDNNQNNNENNQENYPKNNSLNQNLNGNFDYNYNKSQFLYNNNFINNSQDNMIYNQNNYFQQNNHQFNCQNNYYMNIQKQVNQNFLIYNQNRLMNNSFPINIQDFNFINNPQNNNYSFNNPIRKPQNNNNLFYNNNNNQYIKNNNTFHNNNSFKNNNNNIYNNKNNKAFNSNNNKNSENTFNHQNIGLENYKNYSDTSLAKIAPFLIKDQSSCRFIQEKIQMNPSFANDLLFPQLKNSLQELICDQFGNYFFQVLFDVLSFENISEFLTLTQQFFFQICTSSHGTRVIQKLIDKVTASPILLNKFIYNISGENLKEIIKNNYGNHIIQKFLCCVHNSEYTNFIFQIVKDNFLEINNSKHGVCVVQKCISESDENQRPKILNLIIKNIEIIMNDQYGNYVIQYLLVTNDIDFNEIKDIIDKVSENIISYCKRKSSANVIEKCFEHSNETIRNILVNSMLEKDPHSIIELLMDPFGNYIIQKALMVEKGELYDKMLEIISKGINEIKKANYGNKLIVKLLSKHKKLGEMINNTGETFNVNNNYCNADYNNQKPYCNYYLNKNNHN